MKTLIRKILLLVAVTSVSVCAQAGIDPINEGMEMDAHEWCKAVKAGWNLGNALESSDGSWDNNTWKYSGTSKPSTWETKWGNPKTTQDMIKAVKNAGFNAIRIPVLWYPHVTNYETMEIDPTWVSRVKEIVDWCLAEDMLVIINTHHERWLEINPYYSKQEQINGMISKLWVNIANAFADYDGRLAFAGTNEITVNWQTPTKEHQAVQNSYNQTFVDAVRSTGGRNYYRNLVVQTYACSPYHGRTGLIVPTDVVEGRLSVEFHYYDPYNYAGSCEYYYWGNEYKKLGYKTPNDNETTMKNLFSQLKTLWYDKNLGVIVGEYGCSDHWSSDAEKDIQHENIQYYMKTLVGYIRQYGFAGFVWDNNSYGNGSEKFGIFDRRNKMAIRTPYIYKGIMEGAGIEYDPETGKEDEINTDYGDAAKVLWSGEADLAWGDGFQYTIASSVFADFKTNDKLVFMCKRKQMAQNYDMIQIFHGDWSSSPSFNVNGNPTTKEFSPSAYCSDLNNMVVELTFSEAELTKLRSKGLVIQGYGLTLTAILHVDTDKTGISGVQHNQRGGNIAYNLNGIVKRNGDFTGISIKNGKKCIIK